MTNDFVTMSVSFTVHGASVEDLRARAELGLSRLAGDWDYELDVRASIIGPSDEVVSWEGTVYAQERRAS